MIQYDTTQPNQRETPQGLGGKHGSGLTRSMTVEDWFLEAAQWFSCDTNQINMSQQNQRELKDKLGWVEISHAMYTDEELWW